MGRHGHASVQTWTMAPNVPVLITNQLTELNDRSESLRLSFCADALQPFEILLQLVERTG